MSACNGPPVVRTLSGMVAMAGEAEKEVEDGKPKKVKDEYKTMIFMEIRWICRACCLHGKVSYSVKED